MSATSKRTQSMSKAEKTRLTKCCEEVVTLLKTSPPPTATRYSICAEHAPSYNVNVKTLYSRVNRALEPKEKPHGNNLLSREQECQLVGFALALRHAGSPAKGPDVCYHIHIFLF